MVDILVECECEIVLVDDVSCVDLSFDSYDEQPFGIARMNFQEFNRCVAYQSNPIFGMFG